MCSANRVCSHTTWKYDASQNYHTWDFVEHIGPAYSEREVSSSTDTVYCVWSHCLRRRVTFLYSTLVISPLRMSVLASLNSLVLSASVFWTFHLSVIILMSVYPRVLYLLGRLAAWSDILCVHSFVSFLVLTPFIPLRSVRRCFFHVSCISLSVLKFSILWCVDPLLGNSRKQTGS